MGTACTTEDTLHHTAWQQPCTLAAGASSWVLLNVAAIVWGQMCVHFHMGQDGLCHMDMHTEAGLYLQLLLLVGWAMCTRSIRFSHHLPAAQLQRRRSGKVGMSM